MFPLLHTLYFLVIYWWKLNHVLLCRFCFYDLIHVCNRVQLCRAHLSHITLHIKNRISIEMCYFFQLGRSYAVSKSYVCTNHRHKIIHDIGDVPLAHNILQARCSSMEERGMWKTLFPLAFLFLCYAEK